MAINKDTHVSASVILPIEVYEMLRIQAKRNGRSASTEMARAIENGLEMDKDGVDSKKRA